MQEKIVALKTDLGAMNASEKIFILLAMACGFLIASEYAVTRPASNAIFLTIFSAKFYPYVWLATVPLNLFIVCLYNRFLLALGCFRMILCVTGSVILINIFCAHFINQYSWLSFFHYAWKDIYILLMFKQLWSMIHTTIDTSRAKYVYGLLFGIGGVGSVIGSFVPGFLAVQLGSSKLFYFTLPIYALLAFCYYCAMKRSGLNQYGKFEQNLTKKPKPREAFSLIRQSRWMTYILLLVVFMQMSIAFADYQFNAYLESFVPDLDLRTQYCGRMVSIINSITTAFQFLGGFLLIHFLGLRNAHFLVPSLLCANALFFLVVPTFPVISYAYVSIKSIDYSLFGIIREMLYIPLKLDEKFRAKAVIDVFAYRSAKAFASLLLLGFQFVTSARPVGMITFFSITLFLLWAFVVVCMFRQKNTASLTTIS